MNFNRSSVVTFLILGLIILAVSFVAFRASDTVEDGELEFDEAQASLGAGEYTDINGNPLSLEDYKGRVRVVNAWASWCPFCVNELPDFDALAEEYKDKEVVVLAINRKEPKQRAKGFLSTIDDMNELIVALDPSDHFYTSIGGFSMPETVFYSRSGEVVVHKRGFMDLNEMRVHTEAALKAP